MCRFRLTGFAAVYTGAVAFFQIRHSVEVYDPSGWGEFLTVIASAMLVILALVLTRMVMGEKHDIETHRASISVEEFKAFMELDKRQKEVDLVGKGDKITKALRMT